MATPRDPIPGLLRALQRVRDADAKAGAARQTLRVLMREAVESGQVSQTRIAEAFGVSRQRIRQMLNELD